MAPASDTKPLAIRIIPRKGVAFLYTLLGVVLVIVILFGAGTETVNGVVVSGPDMGDAPMMVRLVFSAVILCHLVWYGRRLLPGSPFDYLEIRPTGLTVQGLFGRRQLGWESIASFSVGSVPLSRHPMVWIKVETIPPVSGTASARRSDPGPMRFFMGGYVQI